MKLLSVYRHKDAIKILYDFMMIRMREPETNISHTKMPSMDAHKNFFYHGGPDGEPPYRAWYFVVDDNDSIVGSTYITKPREIGIFILPQYRGKGYGKQAVRMLMDKWPGRFIAHINPKNERSIKMFESLGFDFAQVSYAKN